MDKKFYVITTGNYSDYRIIGITDDETKAHNYCKVFSNCRVEEYSDIWNTSPYVGMHFYTVVLDAFGCDFDDCDNVEVEEVYDDACAGGFDFDKFKNGHVQHEFAKGYYDDYIAFVVAVDEEHARKIGLDRIAIKRAEEADIV